MAIVADELYETVSAGDIKPRHVISFKTPGKTEYLKVNKTSRVKTGKHGAAKVIIEGKYLGSGKNAEMTFTSSTMLDVVVLKKKNYILVDMDLQNDTILVQRNAVGSEEIETLPVTEVDEEDIKKLEELATSQEGEVSFNLVTLPGYFAMEDIKITKNK